MAVTIGVLDLGLHQSGLAPLFFLRAKTQGALTRVAAESAIETVRLVAERVTGSHGYELVDVEIKKAPGGQVVRLFVDKEGGIGLDELQAVSEEVSAILDVEDPLPFAYTLEVSSPGLDRALKTQSDYRRFAGRLAKVSSYDVVDGRRHWTGRIVGLEDGLLTLRLEKEGNAEARVPFDKISHGRLEVEFPSQPKRK
jgi:ribosome maturation factor RimP